MTYRLNMGLTTESLHEISRMKKRAVKEIIRDDFGGWSVLIALCYGKERVFIRNNVDIHSDCKDEFVQFVVSRNRDVDFGKTVVCPVNSRITGIQIVTDRVAWERGGDVWEVEADIGILFTLDGGEEILIEAVDSLAGFMRYYQGEDCLRRLRGIEEQWRMKTDMLTKAERRIRSV